MYFSGVTLSPLGSLKDRVMRDFMFMESRLALKRQELQMAIALLNSPNEKATSAIQGLWKDLAKMELGFNVEIEVSDTKPEDAWLREFEMVKKLKVQIARKKGGGLEVTGL